MFRQKAKRKIASILVCTLTLGFAYGVNFSTNKVFAAANMIAHYEFEDNANDSSTNSNNGTIVGDVRFSEGYSGKAAEFNGTTSYIKLPQNLIKNQSEFSVVTMFKANSGQSGAILGYQNNEVQQSQGEFVPILYIGYDGKMYAELWCGTQQQISGQTVVADGNWHKVALTSSANIISLYIDDELIGTRNGTINNLSMSYNQIGVAASNSRLSASSGWFYYNGMLDDFYIFSKGLTSDEVKNISPLSISNLAVTDNTDITAELSFTAPTGAT